MNLVHIKLALELGDCVDCTIGGAVETHIVPFQLC